MHENTSIKQTVSIGVSTAEDASHFGNIKLPDGSDWWVTILKQADLALYDAKKIRNQVIAFTQDHLSQIQMTPLERRTGSRKWV